MRVIQQFEGVMQDRRGSPIEVRFATERTNEEGAYVTMWWMRVSQALSATIG